MDALFDELEDNEIALMGALGADLDRRVDFGKGR